MTNQDILDKHISKMLNRTEESYSSIEEMREQPEYKTTLDAINEATELLKCFYYRSLSNGMIEIDSEEQNRIKKQLKL